MKHIILFTAALLFSLFTLISNFCYSQEKQFKIQEFIQQDTSKSLGKYYQKYHARTPIKDSTRVRTLSVSSPKEESGHKSSESLDMPSSFWFPGEFEEVQAILITWPYMHVDSNYTRYLEPIDDTLGYYYKSGSYHLEKYVSIIDTFSDTRLPIIFAELADAIQKGNAQVWINICNASDSSIIKHYMNKNGKPLKNYRFFISKNNSFWYRDCGPVAFYQGKNDEVAFLDFEYYGGRPVDDKLPIKIGKAANIPVHTTTIEYEGGNILLDGVGTLFTSDMVYDANQDKYGLSVVENGVYVEQQKTPLTKAQIRDSLIHLLNLSRLEILPMLVADGGTGHIDLYASMWDENNFVYTKYPEEMNKQTDYRISAQNIDSMLSLYSFHNRLYRGEDIPLPRKDDGSWYTNANDFETYTRTYSNSTFVNNVIIQPTFSNENWGAWDWDLQSIEIMKEKFPGYEIIPIDIRGYKGDLYAGFDGMGGAIHCITKQIPAENPIRILHGSLQGSFEGYNNTYPIFATITNKSGIAAATCFWREKGNETWASLPLSLEGHNLFFANLHRDTISNNDTIEYYISATSNNGKTITKPFTAPKGYYSFYEKQTKQTEEPEEVPEIPKKNDKFITIGQPYPNPSLNYVNIRITDAFQKSLTVKITNLFGQDIHSGSFTAESNDVVLQLNTSSLIAGAYFVTLIDESGNITSRKFVVEAK